LVFFDHTDTETGEIVIAAVIHAGHLGCFAADQGATSLSAALDDAGDDAFGHPNVEFSGGVIIEKEQRLGTLHGHVIDAHADEIDADTIMSTGVDGQAQLGADTVGARYQYRSFPALEWQFDERPEAADAREDLRSSGSFDQRFDAFDKFVACVDIDACIAIGEAGGFLDSHGRAGLKNTCVIVRRSMMSMRISTLWRCGVLLFFGVLLAVDARGASETVVVGDVAVSSGGEAGFAEAMRKTLVRATGRRDAAADPVFAPLIADAGRYVQILRPATSQSAARVTLDGEAIGRAIERLGQPVWSSERPVVLGVILSAPSGAEPARVRTELEAAAEERGLPLRLSSAASAGLRADMTLEPAAVLDAARRLGADLALIGQADGRQWQWTLIDGATSTVFPGNTSDGVHGAADILAVASQMVLAQPVGITTLRITGLDSWVSQRAAERLLIGIVGVKRIEVIEVAAGSGLFVVHSAGGEAMLVDSLLRQSRLKREPGSRERLIYRFEP